MRDTEM